MNDFNKLKAQAKTLGLPHIQGENKTSLAIRVQTATQSITAPPKPVKGEPPVFPKHYTNPDDLLSALEKYKARGLQVNVDDDSWFFKRGVAEDSGTLHQPIGAILRSADLLMKARHPAKISGRDGDMVLAG
jgi:hypothetical protein